jgi:hypothetical protein
MISEQEEAMEAALLAGMVKSKMRNIDSMMESRPDVPADRINLHEFVKGAKQTQTLSSNREQPSQNYQVHSIPPIQNSQPQSISNIQTPDNPISCNSLEVDIKTININLEKINNNLAKLTGMFGKVFQNINKVNQK